jgi:hypothetical protein
MHPNANGLAEQLKCVYAAHTTATAASTGDNTEVNGAALDVNGDYQSLKVVIAYSAALTSTETISFTANLQTADVHTFNDGSQEDYGDALSKTAVAGDTGVTSATGVVELDFDLRGAKRWVRVQYTPDLSAGGTDTLAASAVYILGGSRVQPIGSKAN